MSPRRTNCGGTPATGRAAARTRARCTVVRQPRARGRARGTAAQRTAGRGTAPGVAATPTPVTGADPTAKVPARRIGWAVHQAAGYNSSSWARHATSVYRSYPIMSACAHTGACTAHHASQTAATAAACTAAAISPCRRTAAAAAARVSCPQQRWMAVPTSAMGPSRRGFCYLGRAGRCRTMLGCGFILSLIGIPALVKREALGPSTSTPGTLQHLRHRFARRCQGSAAAEPSRQRTGVTCVPGTLGVRFSLHDRRSRSWIWRRRHHATARWCTRRWSSPPAGQAAC